MSRDKHCCLCGATRRPTQKPLASFGTNEIIIMKEHRPLQEGRWEHSPQLLLSIQMWRNGGTNAETHMCDDCVVVGLKTAKRFVDESLAALERP